jgi:hypothetical protein
VSPLNNFSGGGQCSKGGKPIGVGAYRLVEPVVGRRAIGTAVFIMVNGDSGMHSTGLFVVPLTASAAA